MRANHAVRQHAWLLSGTVSVEPALCPNERLQSVKSAPQLLRPKTQNRSCVRQLYPAMRLGRGSAPGAEGIGCAAASRLPLRVQI
eukprot:6207177-Pleurochrysis_carterae.AAC.1